MAADRDPLEAAERRAERLEARRHPLERRRRRARTPSRRRRARCRRCRGRGAACRPGARRGGCASVNSVPSRPSKRDGSSRTRRAAGRAFPHAGHAPRARGGRGTPPRSSGARRSTPHHFESAAWGRAGRATLGSSMPYASDPAPAGSPATSGSSAFRTSRHGAVGRDPPPPSRDRLELAVAIELVAEQVPEPEHPRAPAPAPRPRARPRRPRTRRDRRSRHASSADATPEARFAPAAFRHSRRSGSSMAASIFAVVVLPFVAETTTTPPAIRRDSLGMASGAIRRSSLPGRLVPPPAPARRDSPAAARAAATLAGKTIIRPNPIGGLPPSEFDGVPGHGFSLAAAGTYAISCHRPDEPGEHP